MSLNASHTTFKRYPMETHFTRASNFWLGCLLAPCLKPNKAFTHPTIKGKTYTQKSELIKTRPLSLSLSLSLSLQTCLQGKVYSLFLHPDHEQFSKIISILQRFITFVMIPWDGSKDASKNTFRVGQVHTNESSKVFFHCIYRSQGKNTVQKWS